MTQTVNDAASGWTPGQIRGLKIAVIGMGVLLVLGFAALMAGLYYQAGKIGKPAAASGSQRGMTPSAAGNSAPLLSHIKLAPGSEIVSFSYGDNVLAVQVKTPEGAEIVLIDGTAGRELNRVRFTAQ
jgi:hypothetical protein